MNRLRDWLNRKATDQPPALLGQLIENLPHVVFQLDAGGQWRFLSKAWASLTGLTIDECIDTHYSNAIHPRDRERCKSQFSLLSHGGQCTLAIRLGRESDRYQWVEVHAAGLIVDAQFCGITGTLTNINDRIDEEELLLANQRSLAGMLNDLPGMMYRCRNNIDWTMDYVSAGSLDLTGYPPDDIINNRVISYGGLIHPDDQSSVWNTVQRGIRERRHFELTYRIITASGNEKWVSERGRGLFSSNGEFLGLEGFMVDITADQQRQVVAGENTLIDPDSGIATLALSLDRIGRAINRSKEPGRQPFALIAILLDRFQSILDRGVDPRAIKSIIAERIQSPLAPLDTTCATNEHQFLILTERTVDTEALVALAQAIQDEFLQPILIGEAQYLTSLSIGVAMGSECHHCADELLHDAERAMHHASALGGGRIECFDPRLSPPRTADYSLGGISND